jgi:hypothetical protein
MSPIEVIPRRILARGVRLMVLAAGLYAVLRVIGFHRLFANDSEGIGALLQIIGTLYSVVYAFATYVIWGQFAAVEDELLKETGALKDLILFSKGLKEATRDPIVRAVRAYARGVVESEWAVLSRGEDTDRTDKLFDAVISSVTELKLENDAELRLHERMLEIVTRASSHRDERLAVSAKRMPRTLLFFVTLTAFSILFLLFFFPFGNLALGAISIALAAMLLYFANFVLRDLDNPFQGTWNVSVDPFNDLLAKAR